MNVILKLNILNIYFKIISNELIIVIKKQTFTRILKSYYSTNYITYCIITFIIAKNFIGQIFCFSW